MKSKCKCSFSFLDNKKLCHGFFPSYCIIIIINKKEPQQRTFLAQMFLFIRTIAASGRYWPLFKKKDSFQMMEVGARGQSGSKPTSALLEISHPQRRKEDLQRSMQVCSRAGGSTLGPLADDQVVLYLNRVQRNKKCTVHLLYFQSEKFQDQCETCWATLRCSGALTEEVIALCFWPLTPGNCCLGV